MMFKKMNPREIMGKVYNYIPSLDPECKNPKLNPKQFTL